MILISMCLLGVECKYNGKSNHNPEIINFLKENNICFIPICPEQLGGLPTPRPCAEIRNGKVYNIYNEDKTENFLKGAKETLKLVKEFNIKLAILKSKSPSCGYGKIYDGTFKGILIDGNGITAEILKENGVKIFNEKNWRKIIKFL